jgi:probable HAF family extracellular repeat protein
MRVAVSTPNPIAGLVGTQIFGGQYSAWLWKAETGIRVITPSIKDYLADAVSGDGSVVVGWSLSAGPPGWRWTENEGVVELSDRLNVISGDGTVLAGGAILWSERTGTVNLGGLPGGRNFSLTTAISADGSTVVGSISSIDARGEAFRWTKATGMIGLGDLPGGRFESASLGVSGDG